MKKKIAVLGSTGSLGKILLKLIQSNKKNFEIVLLTANENYNLLLKQAKFFNVKNIIVSDQYKYELIKKKKISGINIYNNFNQLRHIFKKKKIDYVLSAITGFHGLEPTFNIIKHTKKIAIANKESIICGWSIIEKELKKNKTLFIPVDSEHFSIWSILNNKISNSNIEKIYLTASGGPFLNSNISNLKKVSIKKTLSHPTWRMGKKISVDSATMMNKVFEIIEAKKIFNIDYQKLEIIIHPKSYVHAIVKFENGLTKFLVHDPNMKIPIFNSLYNDPSLPIKTKKIDFDILNSLNFKKASSKRYPSLKILKLLNNKESFFETALLTINDFLVDKFLKKQISFNDISIFLIKLISLKQFKNLTVKRPKNLKEIKKMYDYVSLKIQSLDI